MDLKSFIRDIPDFPEPGIIFKDITPLLAHPDALRKVIEKFLERFKGKKIDKIAGIESRGFLFGVPLAMELGIGFVPIRKVGKLPYDTEKVEYTLEYGTAALEIHIDAARPGERILILDDLLATGGTIQAACQLVETIGGEVAGCAFLVELAFLEARKKLEGRDLHSLIVFA